MVSQNTLITVIHRHNLSDCDLYTPPTTGREGETEAGGDENDQLGHNQELVPKRHKRHLLSESEIVSHSACFHFT